MNILYVVSSDVHQCKSGTEQRTNFLYKVLCELGKVYVVQVGQNQRKINDYYWELPIIKSKGVKRLYTLVESIIVRLLCPDFKLRYYLFSYHLDIHDVYRGVKFDKVVVRYLNNVGIFHLWEYGPLFVDIDDYPMQLYQTLVLTRLSPIRAYMAKHIQAVFIKLCLSKVKGAWIANPDQKSMIWDISRIGILPNVPMQIDISDISKKVEQSEYLFTVGLMSYQPNYEGVDAFLSEIWPRVHSEYPKLEYKIVGKGLSEHYVRKWSSIPNVKVLGFVDDIGPIYAGAMASVVPIESGSGTCIKTVESISNGRMCFSTPFGARGIGIERKALLNMGLCIYETADEFLLYLSNAIHHPDWKRSVEEYGKKKARSIYSYEAFKDAVCKLLV